MTIIRNLSAVDIELNDLSGITVDALSNYDLKEESQNDISNSIDLRNAITAGDITYLDSAGNQLTSQESSNVQDNSLTHAIFIQQSGTNIVNTPHQVLNFVSSGTTITDNNDGSINISVDSDSAIWGNLAGALSDQLDLQTALDLKTDQSSLDAHTGSTAIHFTEASIDHANISNIGTNTHTQIDSHMVDGTVHFTTLEGLSDVAYTGSPSPIDGQVLTWNNTTAFWEPTTISSTSNNLNVVTTAIDYTLVANDDVLLCTAPLTVTLPTAVGNVGKVFYIKRTDNGLVVINTTSSQTIDGDTSKGISRKHTTVVVVSDDTNWFII